MKKSNKFVLIVAVVMFLANTGCRYDLQKTDKTSAKADDDYTREAKTLKTISAKSRESFPKGQKLLKKIRKQANTRKAVLQRPHVFIRSQSKYSGRLYSNHYRWHDRPLFANRMLWEESESDYKYSSIKKTFELYQSYGLDGFATFAWPNQYKRAIKVLFDTAVKMKLNPEKFHIMLEVAPEHKYLNICDDTLNSIEKNPYYFRINGKSVISSYVIDKLPPEKLKSHIDKLRKRSHNKIMFLPQMHFLNFKDETGKIRLTDQVIKSIWKKNGKRLPVTMLLRMMEYLRTYLRVCDGLYVGPLSFKADYTIDREFLDQILYPLFKAVLAEPEFNGKKVFATQACVGYTSYHGAQSRFRDGTKTLRTFFDLALKYRPDVVIGAEWDELNEDTGFQPLVAKPMASQRIIKYYMSRFRGIKPTPNPGDDLSIPNLIISQRRQLMLGWKMDVELLNVPDTDKGEPYTVKLELLDIAGNVFFCSKPIHFDTSIMKDKTFDLPSEAFKNAQVLRSRLTIEYRGKNQVFCEGLPFTVLRPTTCWDQTYFNTPLRNVLQPEKAIIDFTLTNKKCAPGTKQYHVACELESPEKLNIVEVVQDSLEQFAYDPQNEYLQNDPNREMFIFRWHYVNNPHRMRLNFTVKLDNAPSAKTFSSISPNAKASCAKAFSESYSRGLGRWVKSKYYGCADHSGGRTRMISVNKSEIDKAILTVKGVRTSGKNKGKPFHWEIPLKKVEECGIFSKIFDDGLMFALEVQARPLSHPLPLNTKNVKFERTLLSSFPNGILAVRAVTGAGKVYWSKPFAINSKPSRETVPVFVYSDFKKKGIKLEISKNRVPDIQYDFTTHWGNILHTSAGREFYGHLGGFLSTATGFTGLAGSNFTIPFNLYSHGIFKGADTPTPKWVHENGETVIKFDGERGNFLALPNTVIPQRTGFTLSFEIKPEVVKPYQVLFANEGITYGGINLSVKAGKFEMYYTRRNPHDPKLPFWDRTYFKTDIPMIANKWQKVVLTYDESKLTLSANGKSESFPFQGIGLYLQGSGFGGRGKRTKSGIIPFYKGLLRSLHVKHTVD